MIRENNHQLNKTITYAYDLGGNLTVEKEYAFTTAETLPDTPVKTMTGTYDSAWKDKLLSWDGTAMTYDAIGNMLTRGGTTYTWTQGRRLSGVENGKSIKYLYDHTGARVKKTVDNTVTEYQWAGDLLLSEKTDGRIIWYCYDSQANLISVTIRGITYFYVRNVQGDIIALVDADGKVVVKYTSDSWGKVIAVTGELADTVGVQNPFRYKGYYYDNETGMYYLKSRYYDAEIKRFICADGYFSTGVGKHDCNMFLYCNNNPIMNVDVNGYSFISFVKKSISFVKDIVGAVSKGISISGGSAVAIATSDGPSPVMDFVAAGIVLGFSIYEYYKDKIHDNTQTKILSLPRNKKDVVIYRYGGTNPGNLMPSQKDSDTGLSFSTIPPRMGGKAAVTTINTLNKTGIVYAYQDKLTHVSVVPVGVSIQTWINAGSGSIWTQAVKSVVVKWDGGN